MRVLEILEQVDTLLGYTPGPVFGPLTTTPFCGFLLLLPTPMAGPGALASCCVLTRHTARALGETIQESLRSPICTREVDTLRGYLAIIPNYEGRVVIAYWVDTHPQWIVFLTGEQPYHLRMYMARWANEPR